MNNNNIITTSLPAAADFNFAAVGDWGCTSNTNNTVNNIVDKNPELVLALGDYSYNTTSDDCWFKIVKPIITTIRGHILSYSIAPVQSIQ